MGVVSSIIYAVRQIRNMILMIISHQSEFKSLYLLRLMQVLTTFIYFNA